MKNFNLLLILSLAFSLSLTACNDSSKKTKKNLENLNKELEEDKNTTLQIVQSLMENFEKGGQPGLIKISGVIVKDNSEADIRISILSSAGIGKNGVQAKVDQKSQPVLSSTVEKIDLSEVSQKTNLVSLGCDKQYASDLAKERNLEVQNTLESLTKDVLSISAKTVVLCGNLESIQYPFLLIDSDELILNKVDYSVIITSPGSISLNTNKITLLGDNKITTKSVDTSTPGLGTVSSLTLNVLNEIQSNEDGKLQLISTGSSYKEKKEKE